MKKATIKILLIALPVFGMISCKPTVKVTTDYDRSADFTSYKTFGMYYLATKNVNQLNEERIWNSIRTEMLKKGYVESNSNPDLLVNAVSVLKNKKYVGVSSNFYGYGSAYRPYGYLGGARMVSGSGTVQTYDYKNGSLKIDVVDTKSDRLIWQGTGSADLEKQPKNPEEAIQQTVAKIMAGLPGGDSKK